MIWIRCIAAGLLFLASCSEIQSGAHDVCGVWYASARHKERALVEDSGDEDPGWVATLVAHAEVDRLHLGRDQRFVEYLPDLAEGVSRTPRRGWWRACGDVLHFRYEAPDSQTPLTRTALIRPDGCLLWDSSYGAYFQLRRAPGGSSREGDSLR